MYLSKNLAHVNAFVWVERKEHIFTQWHKSTKLWEYSKTHRSPMQYQDFTKSLKLKLAVTLPKWGAKSACKLKNRREGGSKEKLSIQEIVQNGNVFKKTFNWKSTKVPKFTDANCNRKRSTICYYFINTEQKAMRNKKQTKRLNFGWSGMLPYTHTHRINTPRVN